MIDFRYHVVSLAAVLAALAVGVVLGSGPMRSAFVGELAGDIDALEAELEVSERRTASALDQALVGDQFAVETAPALVGGRLEGAQVAIVAVGNPDAGHVESQRALLVDAGADVVAEVAISDMWTQAAQNTFRASLALQLEDSLTGLPPGSSSDDVLAHALAQSLMPFAESGQEAESPDNGDMADPGPQTAQDRGQVLSDLLRDADLMTGTVSSAATAVVFVAGPGSQDDDARARQSESFASVAGIAAQYSEATVVASGADAPGDVPAAVMNTADFAADVSTVRSTDNPFGVIAAVLALVEQYQGGQGHYGPGAEQDWVPQLDANT
jgi:hypothetical protein